MKLSRSFAAGAAGLLSFVALALPAFASADIFDYQYCVSYSSPTYGDCRSQGYGYHTYPYIYPAGSTQNGGYYGGYNQPYYQYQQYQQPTYYYPQQYSYYGYPQAYYQPSYYGYGAPTAQTYNGYYYSNSYYGGNYGGGYYY